MNFYSVALVAVLATVAAAILPPKTSRFSDVPLPERLSASEELMNLGTTPDDYLVTSLPNVSAADFAKLPKMYAGLIPVRPAKEEGYLFFWHFESTENPDDLIMWINGGPGCSSISDGLFSELGPIQVDPTTNILSLRDESWLKAGSLLFVDQPVGVGFSYIKDDKNMVKSSAEAGKDMVTFYKNYFAIFGDQKKKPLYLAGESYAGAYLPNIAKALLDDLPSVKLTGVAIGNGYLDPVSLYTNYGNFAEAHGIISPEQANYIKKNYIDECVSDLASNYKNQNYSAPSSCDNGLNKIMEASGPADRAVNVYDITNYSVPGQAWPPNVPLTYLSLASLRTAVNIPATLAYPAVFQECSGPAYDAFAKDEANTVVDIIPDLIPRLKSFMLFNGLNDLICNHMGMDSFIRKMDLPSNIDLTDSDRYTWIVDGAVAGYSRSAANFVEVQVLHASHMVPYSVPKQSVDMIQRFVQGKTFHDSNENVQGLAITAPPATVSLLAFVLVTCLLVAALPILFFFTRRKYKSKNHYVDIQ